MKIFTKTKDILELRKTIELEEKTIGFVPTMGNLHKGHLSLIKKSLEENQTTIISVFVNPKQFAPNEDFEKYPRTLEADKLKIEAIVPKTREVILFVPERPSEIYVDGFQTQVKLISLTDKLCGHFRSGHFDGVTTVVYQLFAITNPTYAYFGQKDYQQFKVIERMVKDLRLAIKVKNLPIIRDEDGLAFSSRNQYLDKTQRIQALKLPLILEDLEKLIISDDLQAAKERIRKELDLDTNYQYLEILDADSLELPNDQTKELLIAGAMFQGTTRLIDNRLLILDHVR